MKRTFKFNAYGETFTMRCVRREYRHGGGLAVLIQDLDTDEDPGYWEPYAVGTVNLDPYTGEKNQSETLAYFDVNNAGQELLDTLVREGFCRHTGKTARSGYCTYPLMEWDLEKLVKF